MYRWLLIVLAVAAWQACQKRQTEVRPRPGSESSHRVTATPGDDVTRGCSRETKAETGGSGRGQGHGNVEGDVDVDLDVDVNVNVDVDRDVDVDGAERLTPTAATRRRC